VSREFVPLTLFHYASRIGMDGFGSAKTIWVLHLLYQVQDQKCIKRMFKSRCLSNNCKNAFTIKVTLQLKDTQNVSKLVHFEVFSSVNYKFVRFVC
jgi:hypothetical protein